METSDPITDIKCLNCESPISQKANFCPHCSQKVRESKISIGKLLFDFLEGFFNLDSRFFLTFLKIWSPALLSIEYIRGKRKTYLNPVRLFLFSMVLFFAALALLTKFSDIDKVKQRSLERIAKSEIVEEFDSLSQVYQIPSFLDSTELDSLKKQLFDNIPPASEDTVKVIGDLTVFSIDLADKWVLRKDLHHLTVDECLDKHMISGFKERLIIGQILKAMKDPKETVRFAFGNLIWVVILTSILTALLMKLLYIRRNYFYVEHFIFLLNLHSIGFLLFTILIVLKLVGLSENILTIAGVIFLIYLIIYGIIAVNRYYKQNIVKTLLKILIITIGYFFFANLLTLVVIIGSVLLF
jgi:hypothetical protein